MHSPQHTLDAAIDRASEITWWNRSLTKLNRIPDLDNAVEFAETDLVESSGPYVELVKAPQPHDRPAAEFLDDLGYHNQMIDGVVRELFGSDRSGTLYEHQAQTIEAIERDSTDTILSVPTATGKTEAFFFPVLNHCLSTDEPGLKSLIVYPMKTLSVDQLNRFLTYLDHVNRDRPPEDRVTVGIWDGDTPHDVGSRDYEIEVGSYIRGLECPRTNEKLRVQSATTVGTDETEYSWVRVTRESVKQGVDILLTNPEALDYMFVNDSPDTRNVLGSRPGEHPVEHIVLDEAHVWSGISGAAISLLIERLKQFYDERNPQVTMVSATVDNPADLAESLTGTPEDRVTDIGFTPRDIEVTSPPDFDRLEPTTLEDVTRVLATAHLECPSRRALLSERPELEAAVDTLVEVGLLRDDDHRLAVAPEHADWVVGPIDRRLDELTTTGAYDSPRAVLNDEEGREELQAALVDASGTASQWYDFVVDEVPEVAAFAEWFETDTTGSVGFKKFPTLVEELERRGVDDPEPTLRTVMLLGRLAGIVTEKYHNFLKPPSDVYWCSDCGLVSRSSACRDCGQPIPELQFCRRCHHPFVAVKSEESDEDQFAPVGADEQVDSCPGCGTYVNTTDIEVPTPTLLSFMLTEICRTAPSEKTLVFSDSHAAAESVGSEIIGTEYGLMAETLYVERLLSNDGVYDNYEAFQDVSQRLREEYWEPLFQNEVDQDGESFDMLRQLRDEITTNAMLSNCQHLLRNALVTPETLFQTAENRDDTDLLVIGHELYRLFAENPTVGFDRETVSIDGLTRDKICSRVENRTTYARRTVERYVTEALPHFLELEVITERSWDEVRRDVTESDVGGQRQERVFDYIEAERDHLNGDDAFDRSFDSGVFTRDPKFDESDLRLLPRVTYCTECYRSFPVPTTSTVSRCRNCGAEVETYDRFTIEPDGSYSGSGYADVDSEWTWPVDHWAYEVSAPLTEHETLDFVTAGVHKGNIPPTLRGAIEEGFRKDDPDINVVSATPTMELGVDIGSLDTVTQVGMPPTLTNYVQRSGRTGRKRGSASLVMTVVRGDHPVDNHYYANLEGFFREFEPVRVPDPYDFDELLAGHVVTSVVGYLARNPHQSNVFEQIYRLPESNTDLESYVSNVEERLDILQEFVEHEVRDELEAHVRDVFGERGVEVFERVFFEDGPIGLAHRVDQTFSQLGTMAGSAETNKRLTDRHDRLDSWLSLLGYLANYRDFGQRFPVKFSGRNDSIEFESSGRLYDMFPGEENGRGSVITLQGTKYIVDDVHGTTTPLSEVAVCSNEDCDQPFKAYDVGTDTCPHCETDLEVTAVHGVGSVECKTARGGEKGYTTRGVMSTHVTAGDDGTQLTTEERELFGLPCTVEQGGFTVTDFVFAFERGHSQSPDRTTLRSEALIEREKGQGTEDLSWEERLQDVTEETYAPVGQRYHTQGLKLSFPRTRVAERIDSVGAVDELWPQALSSLERALTKAVAIVAEADQGDFRIKTNLAPEVVEVYVVDSRRGGNGITWQVRQEIDEEVPRRVTEVASCDRCADYCEECLLLARTPPAYLENDLLNKHTLRAVIGTAGAAGTEPGAVR